MQEPGEHLERRRFSGAIGPEESDQFPFLNGEADIADGMDVLVLPGEESFDGASKSRLLLRDPEGFRQVMNVNH